MASTITAHELTLELWSDGPEAVERSSASDDQIDLVDEVFADGVLSGRLPDRYDDAEAAVAPVWTEGDAVGELEVAVRVRAAGREHRHGYRCTAERWSRTAEVRRQALVAAGRLAEEETLRWSVTARRDGEPSCRRLPPLSVPPWVDGPLEEHGIRLPPEWSPDPARPVLLERRLVLEILQGTMDGGYNEAGGAVLGKIVRLPEPLPGTETRLVTVLTAGVSDGRHRGTPGRLHFDPQALIDAAAEARRRGRGESVLTAWHSHGWSAGCRHCQRPDCPLPHVGQVSVDDYRVLESLFPSKATLMPIAGRLPGADGDRPALIVYRWHGGVLRPLVWELCSTDSDWG